MPKIAELADNVLDLVADELEIPKELILSKSRKAEIAAVQRGREEEAKLPVWDKLILQLNPEVAEKQRQEQEIATLKGQMATMASDNAELKSMLAQVLSKLDGDSNKSGKNK